MVSSFCDKGRQDSGTLASTLGQDGFCLLFPGVDGHRAPSVGAQLMRLARERGRKVQEIRVLAGLTTFDRKKKN